MSLTHDVTSVIESYKLAQRQRSTARTVICVLTIFLLGIFMGTIWNTLDCLEDVHALQGVRLNVLSYIP